MHFLKIYTLVAVTTFTMFFVRGQSLQFTPPPGQYDYPVRVTIQSVPDDIIVYSLDGHYPDSIHGKLYSDPIQLSYPDTIPEFAALEPDLPERMGGSATLPPASIHKIHVLQVHSKLLDTTVIAHYWIDSIPETRTGLDDVFMIASDADSLFGEGENGGILVGNSYYNMSGNPLNVPMANAIAVFQEPLKQPDSDSRLYFTRKDGIEITVNNNFSFSPDSAMLTNTNFYFDSPFDFVVKADVDSFKVKGNHTYIRFKNPRCSDLSPFYLPVTLVKTDIAGMFNIPENIYRKNVTLTYFEKGTHRFTRKAWMQQLGTATRLGKKNNSDWALTNRMEEILNMS